MRISHRIKNIDKDKNHKNEPNQNSGVRKFNNSDLKLTRWA